MYFIDLNQTKQNEIHLSQPGSYTIFFFNYSSKLKVNIQHQDIEVNLLGIYIGSNKNEFHLETIQKHDAGKTTSNLFVKGVFFDASQFDYQGLIKIQKNAQQSHAYQKNQNLIMGDNARVSSNPFLEIEANDVFCTHGSTTGKLNEDELHYLHNRGINNQKGENLLIHGFLNEIFDIMKASKIDSKIISKYQKKTNQLLKNLC